MQKAEVDISQRRVEYQLVNKVNILGEDWFIKWVSKHEDSRIENVAGICDFSTREILIRNDLQSKCHDMRRVENQVLRHEIVHAFLEECGLSDDSCAVDCWARNEEMVDWFAFNGPKIYNAWLQADCLDEIIGDRK